MYDINFFKNSNNLKKEIICGQITSDKVDIIYNELENIRQKFPYIYNIETTNYCNMKCVMCPRTMFMTRKNIWIDDDMFKNILNSVKVHNSKDLDKFWKWLTEDFKQDPKEISENGFYFSIVSKHLVLHGFGEPFLDKKLVERVKMCTEKKFQLIFHVPRQQ